MVVASSHPHAFRSRGWWRLAFGDVLPVRVRR
jgi:hypothetical protein